MDYARRVLVLDGDAGSALAIVRSLARRGLVVDVADRAPRSLSAYSRYRSGVFVYPDPRSRPDEFTAWVRERVRRERYDLVIPVTDDTQLPLAERRAEIERHTRLAIADTDALEIMTDKDQTLAVARRLGVPAPEGHSFDTAEALETAIESLEFPVVIKPARTMAARPGDARVSLAVRYATDAAELRERAREPLALGAVIVQEYVVGQGVGVEVLADRGEIVYAFQHERLHEMPLTGGGSCLRRSVPVDPTLLEYSRRLIAETAWHGVAMVEFKVDPERDLVRLMEVNGRFWGSLPLGVASGADFPAFLYDLLVEGRRPDAPPARTGIVARRLWYDLFWYVEVFRRTDPSPLIRWPSRSRALRDLLLVFSPRHVFDVQRFTDAIPGIVDAVRAVRELGGRFTDLMRRRLLLGRARRARAAEMLMRSRLYGARSFLFVCYGNINRSAVAQRHLADLLDGVPGFRIESAGFHDVEGRAADPVMVDVAEERGLSLRASSSRRVDRAMVEAADLVFVMEAEQAVRLGHEIPSARRKTLLLGSTSPDVDVPLEIADPYGHDRDDYERCFRAVVTCTTAIADATRRGRPVVEEHSS